MFDPILESNSLLDEYKKYTHVFYGLTKSEASAGFIKYTAGASYSGKGVNTTLNGLVRFLTDHHMQEYITHWVKIPISKFTINTDIYPDKEYDMITVKTPFRITFTDPQEIKYPKTIIKETTLMFTRLLMEAAEDPNTFNKAGKIPALEDAFSSNPIAKKVAYGIATSHEYDKPNIDAALSMAKNYDWVEDTMNVDDIEGIEKPVNNAKVLEIANTIKEKGNSFPVIVVDKVHGITPQSPGKGILLDGHHRKKALSFVGEKTTPVYKGTYTGAAEKPSDELALLEGFREDHWSPKKKSTTESSIDHMWDGTPKSTIPQIDTQFIELLDEAAKVKFEKIPLTAEEQAAVTAKYGKTECSFHKNAANGKYFCMTHRTRSKYYDSPTDIPKAAVKFVSSTS
jgi:hypothetical protein